MDHYDLQLTYLLAYLPTYLLMHVACYTKTLGTCGTLSNIFLKLNTSVVSLLLIVKWYCKILCKKHLFCATFWTVHNLEQSIAHMIVKVTNVYICLKV